MSVMWGDEKKPPPRRPTPPLWLALRATVLFVIYAALAWTVAFAMTEGVPWLDVKF